MLFIVLGDPRTNQNPAFLALGILFYRWHNVLASRIKTRYPLWRDEDVFQAARRWNIASLQVIIFDISMMLYNFEMAIIFFEGTYLHIILFFRT